MNSKTFYFILEIFWLTCLGQSRLRKILSQSIMTRRDTRKWPLLAIWKNFGLHLLLLLSPTLLQISHIWCHVIRSLLRIYREKNPHLVTFSYPSGEENLIGIVHLVIASVFEMKIQNDFVPIFVVIFRFIFRETAHPLNLFACASLLIIKNFFLEQFMVGTSFPRAEWIRALQWIHGSCE